MALQAYNKAIYGGLGAGSLDTSVEPIVRWVFCDLIGKCPPELVIAAISGLLVGLLTAAIITRVPNVVTATGGAK